MVSTRILMAATLTRRMVGADEGTDDGDDDADEDAEDEAEGGRGRMARQGAGAGGAGAGGGEARTFYARSSLRAHSPRLARSSPSAAAGATPRQRQRELSPARPPYSPRSGVGSARTYHARRARSAAAFYYASACGKRWAGPCTTCTCRRPSTPPSQGRESPAA